jgi:hypothetical protein
VVNFHLYSSIALPTKRELPVSFGWRQVTTKAGLEALEKCKISAHATGGIKVTSVIVVKFVTFVTKVTVVNRNVGTYGTRGNNCKHLTHKIGNTGKKKLW